MTTNKTKKTTTTARKAPAKKKAKAKPSVRDNMTNRGSHLKADGSLAPGKDTKPTGILQAVKDGVNSAIESVGEFVHNLSSKPARAKKSAKTPAAKRRTS